MNDLQRITESEASSIMEDGIGVKTYNKDKQLTKDNYVCDCMKNYGNLCKYPEKYKDGGCK